MKQRDASDGSLYPAKVINTIPHIAGDGGESSGGNLATKLNSAYASTHIFVTYLSTGDANQALTSATNPAKEMSYNGVFLGAAPFTSVTEGKYTFWSYEHLMYRSSLASTKLTVATALATKISTDTATVKESAMSVQRPTDGAPITAKYF
ncbi:MAG: hypothetical protein WDN28_24765 [Chthoniobacter sp.]